MLFFLSIVVSGGGLAIFGDESTVCFIQSHESQVDISPFNDSFPSPNVACPIDKDEWESKVATFGMQDTDPSEQISLIIRTFSGLFIYNQSLGT